MCRGYVSKECVDNGYVSKEENGAGITDTHRVVKKIESGR